MEHMQGTNVDGVSITEKICIAINFPPLSHFVRRAFLFELLFSFVSFFFSEKEINVRST